MSIFALLSLFSCIAVFLLSNFIFYKSRKSEENIVFLVLCIFIIMLGFSEFMYRQTENYITAGIFIRVWAIWYFGGALFLHFALALTGKFKLLKKKFIYFLLYTPPLIFCFFDLTTKKISPIKKYWGYTYNIADYSTLYYVTTMWLGILVSLTVFLLMKYYLNAEGIKKKQVKIVIAGFILPLLISFIDLLDPNIIRNEIPEFTVTSLVWLVGFIGYAIWKYQLFTVDLAIAAENIIFTMPGSLFLLDNKGKILLVNRALVNLLEYKENELIEKSAGMLFVSEEDFRNNILKKLLDTGFIESYETKYKTKSGEEIFVSFSGSIVYNKQREILRVVGIARDINEHKLKEQKLKESEERFRVIFDNATDGIILADPENKKIYIGNKKICQMLGYNLQELQALKILDIHPEDSLPFVIDQFERQARNEFTLAKNLPVKRKDGSIFFADVNASSVLLDGKTYLAGFFRDVTERKNAEEMIFSEKERLAVTLRSIGEAVITTDLKSKIVIMNKVAEQLTGWNQKEASDKYIGDVFHIINENTGEVNLNSIEQAIKTGIIIDTDSDNILMSKDGTERIVAKSVASIRDRNSKIIGVVLVFRDVTKIRKMEKEFIRSQKLESLGILAGGIAHDFNNILTAIIGNISIAKMELSSNEEIVQILADAEKASWRAKDLSMRLLTFSKGGTPIKRAASIPAIIKDSAKFALRGSNVKCDFVIPDDIWTADVDEGQIGQVINNLIINAEQAVPSGGVIELKIENIDIHESALPISGKYVKISIKDNGIGISPENISKIFDPYFTTKEKGSGLGLTVSYSIIKNHNGYIDVESNVGTGTIFRIYIPVSKESSAIDIQEKAKIFKGKGKILLMDDEDYVRRVAGRMLEYLGYEVNFAKDGTEAIDLYKKSKETDKPFDALIMDLTIPGGMGGRECIDKLLALDKNVKVIVSSGYSNDKIMSDFKKYGFKDVVIKPYKIEELGEVLHKALIN